MSFIASWWSSGGGGGIPYMFCTAAVYPSFFAVVTALLCSQRDQWKTACSVPTSSDQRSDVSTLRYWRWNPPSAPKGWPLWTPSWNQRLSALLLARIISPFKIVISIRQGVLRGHRASSSSLNSPRGQFRLSPHSLRKGVESWGVRAPVKTLLAGSLVGTGRLVPLPWRSTF